MSFPIIELEPKKSRQAQAVESITEMLTTYNQKQKSKQLADLIGIPKDKRDAFASLPPEWQKTYATMFQKERAGKEKLLAGSKKYLKGSLPEDLSLENQIDEITPIYENYIRQGFSQSEARDKAISDYRTSSVGQEAPEKGGFGAGLLGIGGGSLMQLLKGSKLPAAPIGGEGFKPEPFSREKAKEIAKSPFVPAGEAIKAAPGKSALSTLLGTVSPIEEFATRFDPNDPARLAFELLGLAPKRETLSSKARAKLGEGLTPQQQKGLADLELWGSMLPILELVGLAKGMKGAQAISPSEILGPEAKAATQTAQKRLPFEAPPELTFKPGEEGPPVKETPTVPKAQKSVATPKKPLEGRVTKPPETSTELRMERLSPEEKIYPRLQNIELREKQLKMQPRYVEEIETDAAERAKRAEARIPKTVKGKDAQRIRIHEAEKQWPVAQESYNKSAGRVRALEDEVASLKGEARELAESYLELAKKDLDDATRNLKNAWENLEGTNYRATVQEMRDAARKKMLDIQDAIAADKEYELHKRDYSPDLIAKAKQISKLKPIPKARKSDFYTQVHDTYVNEYKTRVSEIDKELKGLPKTMEGLSRARPLQKEKEILNKMIQSAEAEKTIQNRRFGLREMAERHKAQERFKGLQKAEGKPEVSQVAQDKMWKKRIQEAKSPAERSKVIDDAIEQIVTEQPRNAEQIRAEASGFKEAAEDLRTSAREPKEPPSGKGARMEFPKEEKAKTPPPPPKQPPKPPGAGLPKQEEIRANSKIFDRFTNQIKELKESFPFIWRTKTGKDLITGSAIAIADEFLSDFDFPFTGSAIVAATLGSGRGGTRVLANMATKYGIRKWKESQAEDAYRRKDAMKFRSYSPSIQKKVKDKMKGL